jgi:hypothetical protein
MRKRDACVVTDGGSTCLRGVEVLTPVKLCRLHALEVSAAVLPTFLNQAAREERFAVDGRSLLRPLPEPLQKAKAVSVRGVVPEAHEDVVYFLRNGNRIKIGWSSSLATRLRALCLPRDSAVLLLSGGVSLEGRLHKHFSAYRVPGTEWFSAHPELTSFIEAMQPSDTCSELRKLPRRYVPVRPNEGRNAVRTFIHAKAQSGVSVVRPMDFGDLLQDLGRTPGWLGFQIRHFVDTGELTVLKRGVYEITLSDET